MARLSVIIPTYNRKETLKTTLLSLDGQTSKEFEVIVADDGSSDGTEQMVKGLKVSYPLIHTWNENAGRSAARNMGIERSTGEFILFIDDHIVVDKKLVEEHIKTHDSYRIDGVRVVRGRVDFIETAEDAPKTTEYIDLSTYKAPRYEQEPFRVFITNNISVEKKALMSVFGFDEDFKEYGLQDAETGYRLKAAGYKYKINPNAVGYIFGVGLTFEKRCNRRRQVGRSSVLFYKKHPTLLVKINLSIHAITLILQKVLSVFGSRLPQRYQMFYNFSCGVAEGLGKYKDIKFKTMHSRFKGNKKSILFVSHISDLSGAPISLSLIAKGLNKDKYHTIVAVPQKGSYIQKLEDLGINYQIYKDNLIHHLFPSFKIWQILKDRQIDLIYLNTSATMWAAKPAILLKIPVIAHIREDLRGLLNHVLRMKIILWTNKIVLISNWMRKFLYTDKAIVIHNTVDLKDFEKLEPSKIKQEFNLKDNTILFVGSLEERKGIKYLIRSLSLLKRPINGLKTLILGSSLPGGQRYVNMLKKASKGHNIEFLGSRSSAYDIMAASTVLAAPSLSEAFGRVIIEAMACGKPVVATNVGGIPEIIEDGITGKLVPPHNAKALADALYDILSDREKAKKMGEAGRRRVETNFSLPQQIRKIEGIIDEYIKKR